ncbi:FAD binding domain-containing protein [Gloeopeniophorella convolvens]|nr:FAD binding domain-containing protein [Gloeopeniophorella convolvens]
MSDNRPVLVVGSGPSGLTAALTLRKNDIPIRVIERRGVFSGGIRGTAYQPRVQEIFESLGVLDEIEANSTLALQMAVHGSGLEIVSTVEWAEEADPSPGVPYVRVRSLHQSTVEQILRAHLEKLGVQVELNTEIVGLEQREDHVIARLKTLQGESEDGFSYVVAGDGAKGTVRKMLGVPFVGETKEEDTMLVGNVEVPDFDRNFWHRWGNFVTKFAALKPIPPAPMFQIQILGKQLPSTLPTDLEGIQALFNDIAQSSDIKLNSATWVSAWHANIRMADKFSVGRVFLIGDSAHCHSPAGGQGANSGITDGFNVAYKIALVHKGIASSSLLDSYQLERMPVIAEMLKLTNSLHNTTWPKLPPSTLDATVADTNTKDDQIARPRHLLQLGVNYRWSSVVFEGREPASAEEAHSDPYGVAGSRLRAGDRAPDAPELVESGHGERARLFEVIRGANMHHVLVFSGPKGAEEVLEDVSKLGRYTRIGIASIIVLSPLGIDGGNAVIEGARQFVDTKGHAYAGYEVGADEGMFVVIRPDGMIGAFAKRVSQVNEYFGLFLA